MEEESIVNANSAIKDAFSPNSHAQRENANAVFTSDKLDKLGNLLDLVKKLTIKNWKYYESNTATASDAQGDFTHNPETFTQTSNGNKTVTHASNRNFEQKLLSNRTIRIVVPKMNPRINHSIAQILMVPQTLLMPVKK